MTIKLYELLGHEDRRYSQFSWRAKMALKHKGLDFEQIPLLLTDKESIAFAKSNSVPVLVDGDRIETDSWDIAVYLEEAYPDGPSLFGGPIGTGVTRVINSWCDRAVNVALGPLIARDVLDAAHPDDREYFRESMEKLYKRTLEEVQDARSHPDIVSQGAGFHQRRCAGLCRLRRILPVPVGAGDQPVQAARCGRPGLCLARAHARSV